MYTETNSINQVFTDQWLNRDDPIMSYRNNPLIGSLGPILTGKQIQELLTIRPAYDESERSLATHLRPHAAFSMRRLFVPTPQHTSVVAEIDILLRQGYVHRNPLDLNYRRQVLRDKMLLKNNNVPPERFRTGIQLGTAAMGPAGTGKTMSFECGISNYPQVINHCYEVSGANIAFKQVTVLKLNMFQDASLKALGIEFFNQLSATVNEPVREKWGIDRCNRNDIQSRIYLACMEYCVGMIVVDEVQNISALGDNYATVLRYFVRIMNTVGVPVALIGTNTARALIDADLAASRRFLGNIPAFTPFVKGVMWTQFIKELWRYQYLNCYTAVDGLDELILELTGGIPDLVVKLYLLIQLRLFGKKSEVIDKSVIKQTADLLLYSVRNRIDEIKGTVPASAGLARTLAGANEEFMQHANEECSRIGATVIFADAKPAPPVEIITAATAQENSDTSLIGAKSISDAKGRLARRGQLGLNR